MKKNPEKLKFQKIDPKQIDDRLLLINLYLTQGLTLVISIIIFAFQRRNPLTLMKFPENHTFFLWAGGLALVMFILDLTISKLIPEASLDDGGINEMLFKKRPIWHIVIIAAVVAICEELLFRGAIQHAFGVYWTSVLFAFIHVRYLRHWIPTAWVFASSYGLGFIYIQSGTLWAPIVCHFLIDLISGLVIRFRR